MTDTPTLDDIKASLGIPDAVVTLSPNGEWYWITLSLRTPDDKYHSKSVEYHPNKSNDAQISEIKQQFDDWKADLFESFEKDGI